MKSALEQFIDEAIQLELNAAEIYSIISETIPEDANFCATLAWEERTHFSKWESQVSGETSNNK